MKNSSNGSYLTGIKILVLVVAGLDVIGLIFLRQSYAVYTGKYEFLAGLWFGLDSLVTISRLIAVIPFLRLEDWARRTLIGTSCYSIFSSLRFLTYTLIDSSFLTTREAFVNIVSDFIVFLALVIIPTLIIYFLQAPQILRTFDRDRSEARTFLLFDRPPPKVERALKLRRLIAAGIDLILFPLIFGVIVGIGLLKVESIYRNQVLFWIGIVGNALIWRDCIFSPGRYFLGLRLVVMGADTPVRLYSSKFFHNFVRVILRNLLLLIPFILIFGYIFEIVMVLVTGNRFSDRIAGTTVKRVTKLI